MCFILLVTLFTFVPLVGVNLMLWGRWGQHLVFVPSLVVPVGQGTDPVFDDVEEGSVSVALPVGVVTYSGPAVLRAELRSAVIGVRPGSVHVVPSGSESGCRGSDSSYSSHSDFVPLASIQTWTCQRSIS